MLVNMLENADVFRSEEMVGLIARARSTRDEDERLRLYRELDRLVVAEHAALVPIAYSHTLLLHRPWVEGVLESPLVYLLSTADQAVVRR
jgi:ABC-type transport system substrate-binding protein